MDKLTIYRKPIDVVLMFKVIFLQRYYGLGDHQIQYQKSTAPVSANFLASIRWLRFLTRRPCGHAVTALVFILSSFVIHVTFQ